MRSGQYGWSNSIDYFKSNTIFITEPAPVTPNYGVLNIGSGTFDGLGTGKFVGSVNGTYIAVNAPSGYTGNLIDLQLAGVSQFLVTSNGAIQATSFSTDPTDNGGSLTIRLIRSQFSICNTITTGSVLTSLVLGDNVTHTRNVLVTPDGINSSLYGKLTISTGVFSGSSSGTSLAVAELPGFVGNLLDLQVNSISKFKVDSNGSMTATGINGITTGGILITAWGGGD